MIAAALLGGCEVNHIPDPPEAMAAPSKPPNTLLLAEAARQDGEYQAAVKLYRQTIATGHSGYDVHMGLATSLAGMGASGEAIAEFRRAQQLDPTRAEPNLELGRLAIQTHKPENALTAFDAAVLLAPQSARGWDGRGVSLDMLERHQEAQDSYLKGLAIAPDDHVLRNNYGLSLAMSGQYPEAVKVLTALVMEPDATSRNRQNLALALGLAGNAKDAQALSAPDIGTQAAASNLAFYDEVRNAPMPKQSAAMPLPTISKENLVSSTTPVEQPQPATTMAAQPAQLDVQQQPSATEYPNATPPQAVKLPSDLRAIPAGPHPQGPNP